MNFRPKEDFSYYVKGKTSRKNAPSKFRKEIYERDGHKCVTCGAPDNLTLDHIIPRSKGGSNRPENLQTMCKSCNGKKGNLLPEQIVLRESIKIPRVALKKAPKQVSSLELQEVDCNCNDCKFMVRDFEKYNSFNLLYTNEKGQITQPSHRIQYGNCSKLNKPVSFIPNTCQIETQHCFEHRKS